MLPHNPRGDFREQPDPALFASESDGIEREERHFTAEMPVRKVEMETHKGGEQRGSAASYCRLSHDPSCRSELSYEPLHSLFML
jgi:hypothetical protein